jgi:hypothetical protein
VCNPAAKAGLYLDTLDEQRLKKIRDLEAYERPSKAEVEPQAQKPVFITPLNRLAHVTREVFCHDSSFMVFVQTLKATMTVE